MGVGSVVIHSPVVEMRVQVRREPGERFEVWPDVESGDSPLTASLTSQVHFG